jgi:ATP-binding cassette subfamily B protein
VTRSSSHPLPAPPERAAGVTRGDWQTVRTLLPYLLAYKGRVLFALGCLIAAKLANVGVPLVLKQIVDGLTLPPAGQMLVLPVALLVAYGLLRLSTTAFTELREYLLPGDAARGAHDCAQDFSSPARVVPAVSLVAQTGGLTRDVERGHAASRR